MSIIKLKPGEAVIVSAAGAPVGPDHTLPGRGSAGGEHPDHTLPKPPDQAQDPWYGIDLGLGYVRPDNSLPQPQPLPPVDPGYGVDEDTGWVHPDHTLPVPLPPVDPAYGIDEILGYLRPDNTLPVPPDQKPEGPHWEVKVAWTPVSGWIVVAVPVGEHVAPSGAKRK